MLSNIYAIRNFITFPFPFSIAISLWVITVVQKSGWGPLMNLTEIVKEIHTRDFIDLSLFM